MEANNAAFLRFLQETPRIDKNGRLDLEAFCFHFSQCLWLDGLSNSMQPADLCELMVSLILEAPSPRKPVKYIQQVGIRPWRKELARFYPRQRRTIIHVGALILVWDKWLKRVGQMLSLPSEVWYHIKRHTHKVSWLLPKHQFTYTLFCNVDVALSKMVTIADERLRTEEGYSLKEAFDLSMQTDSSLQEMEELLKFLNKSQGQ